MFCDAIVCVRARYMCACALYVHVCACLSVSRLCVVRIRVPLTHTNADMYVTVVTAGRTKLPVCSFVYVANVQSCTLPACGANVTGPAPSPAADGGGSRYRYRCSHAWAHARARTHILSSSVELLHTCTNAHTYLISIVSLLHARTRILTVSSSVSLLRDRLRVRLCTCRRPPRGTACSVWRVCSRVHVCVRVFPL